MALWQFQIHRAFFVGLPQEGERVGQGRGSIQCPELPQIFRSILDWLRSEFGRVRVTGREALRSIGEVSKTRVATVTSEVANPGGK